MTRSGVFVQLDRYKILSLKLEIKENKCNDLGIYYVRLTATFLLLTKIHRMHVTSLTREKSFNLRTPVRLMQRINRHAGDDRRRTMHGHCVGAGQWRRRRRILCSRRDELLDGTLMGAIYDICQTTGKLWSLVLPQRAVRALNHARRLL